MSRQLLAKKYPLRSFLFTGYWKQNNFRGETIQAREKKKEFIASKTTFFDKRKKFAINFFSSEDSSTTNSSLFTKNKIQQKLQNF